MNLLKYCIYLILNLTKCNNLNIYYHITKKLIQNKLEINYTIKLFFLL